jgi:hypothetical protein
MNSENRSIKYYDKVNKRLVFIEQKADMNYWDNLWQTKIKNIRYNKQLPKYNPYLNTTRKYLSPGDLILEGGCGLALNSHHFRLAGFHPIALDYAQKTISFLKENVPEVNPVIGDVRNLELDDNSVHGYWSFGVIEHFYEGYTPIALEAKRIIKKGGYFFVTFPHMSNLRKCKAIFNKYPIWSEEENKESFYQFALNKSSVIKYFSELGFVLEETQNIGGILGLANEIKFARKLLKLINNSNNILIKIIKKTLDTLISPFSSHITLLILKKK